MSDNIREKVWNYLDSEISIKKDLSRNIINTRSLANYIISNQKINANVDAVISAIRRYSKDPETKEETLSVHRTLSQGRISTRTKMSSLLLKRTDAVKTALGRPDRLMEFQGHDVVRVLEGSEALTIVIDQKNLEKVKSIFQKSTILEENKEVGLIEIIYPRILKKTPGVFSVIYNELAESNISIIDALITSNEHILVIEEEKLMKAFDLIYNLCKNEQKLFILPFPKNKAYEKIHCFIASGCFHDNCLR
jgi:hypothetical protein